MITEEIKRGSIRPFWRWGIVLGLILLSCMGFLWHGFQPLIRANRAAKEIEKEGAEVRRIVWSPVYLEFHGSDAPQQLASASQHFADLYTVQYLILNETEVTAEMIPHIRKLKSLQVITLNKTRVSKVTLEALRSQLPALEITSTDPLQ